MVKNISNENLFLKKNANNLLWNIISVLTFKQGKTLEQLSKVTGINGDNLKQLLDRLVKEEKLQKEEDLYILKNEPKSE